MKYPSLHIAGNILSPEIIEKLDRGQLAGQQHSSDFNFETSIKVRDEIARAWADINAYWKPFQRKIESLKASQRGTSETRDLWMKLVFSVLGYELDFTQPETINDKSYDIPFRARNLEGFPVVIISFLEKLDERTAIATRSRMSPHGMLQEYLNLTEHTYGILTNGKQVRLLRDSGRITRPAYLEFDLEQILEEDLYADFALLYRLLHYSRMPKAPAAASESWIEKYHADSLEAGNRIREKLSEAVEAALVTLGNGFLAQDSNEALKEKVNTNTLLPVVYYRHLRRLVYRFLFLMVAEERDLIFPKEEQDEETRRKKDIYTRYYSIGRLRQLSEKMFLVDQSKNDLWTALLTTFRLFEAGGYGKKLGIQPLDGELFHPDALGILNSSELNNGILLSCINRLHQFLDEKGMLNRINYKLLDVEELGSVYEGLLDLQPVIVLGNAGTGYQFVFNAGTERKTTASYYTRPDLVEELIKSALIPVIEERLTAVAKNSGKDALVKDQEKALLSLKVCDTAAGSGHILLAAARTIAWYLARIRTNEDNPSPTAVRQAKREVIQHCIYGVDKNPDAVELCRLALWIEGHNNGKPLSFLEHKIKCGDSLVGVTTMETLKLGIPDEAYTAVTGDDKEACKALKKINRTYNTKKQTDLFSGSENDLKQEQQQFANEYAVLEGVEQDSVEHVHGLVEKYSKLRNNPQWLKDWTACNIYTSAFFYTYTSAEDNAAPTSERLDKYLRNPAAAHGQLVGRANALSVENRFFHWPLEFPDIMEQGGFDVMMGNPPWERIKLQEQEYFATRDLEIAKAANKAARERLIKELPQRNSALHHSFNHALHTADATGKFLRESGRFPLTSRGDINTYSVFAELFSKLIKKEGRMGVLIPTGIATDDSNKYFFSNIVENNRLVSLYDFENREALFKSVHRSYKFCLLTISGKELIESQKPRFGFFLTRIDHLNNKQRIFSLSSGDFLRLNPNTKTCPIFRTSIDAELTAKMYNTAPIFINESKGDNPWQVRFMAMFHMANDSYLFKTQHELEQDKWSLSGNKFCKEGETYFPLYESKFIWHYDHRFGTYEGVDNRQSTQTPTPTLKQYQDPEYLVKPWYWIKDEDVYLQISALPPLIKNSYQKRDYSGIVFGLWLWKAGFYFKKKQPEQASKCIDTAATLTSKMKRNDLIERAISFASDFDINEELIARIDEALNTNPLTLVLSLLKERAPKWLLGWRDITNSTNERTMVSSFSMRAAAGDTFLLMFPKASPSIIPCLNANLNTLPFDFCVRQKVGGIHLKYHVTKQLPVLSPESYNNQDVLFIVPRALELIYTAWDIKAFVDDVWKDASSELQEEIKLQWESNTAATGGHSFDPPAWCEQDPQGIKLAPFKWDEERRAVLKAELDAYYAKLYRLTHEELRYILDPHDVYGKDFPGETFRVLKDKDIRKYGEYRTKRLVLEAWERLGGERYIPVSTGLAAQPRVSISLQNLGTEMKEFSLHEGIYSINDTAAITGLTRAKVRSWFGELSKQNYEGLDSQKKSDIDSLRISFHGLIELVVIGTLRENGFSLKKILKARTDLKTKTGKEYPFATNNVRDNLKVAGQSLVFELPTGIITLDGTGQYNLEFIKTFFRDIEFDVDGVAQRLVPTKGKGKIVIDPKEGGGKPVVKGKEVLVDLITSIYAGPESLKVLKDQYNLEQEEVLAAVEYNG